MATVPAARAEDNLRHLLKAHPGIRATLERHGLMGCGGEEGPDETVGLFARAHRIDLGRLLADLNAAIAESGVVGANAVSGAASANAAAGAKLAIAKNEAASAAADPNAVIATAGGSAVIAESGAAGGNAAIAESRAAGAKLAIAKNEAASVAADPNEVSGAADPNEVSGAAGGNAVIAVSGAAGGNAVIAESRAAGAKLAIGKDEAASAAADPNAVIATAGGNAVIAQSGEAGGNAVTAEGATVVAAAAGAAGSASTGRGLAAAPGSGGSEPPADGERPPSARAHHGQGARGFGDRLFRPFILASLASTVTLGTVFGAANLLVIHGGKSASWINPAAHATAQLFGFVLLFIVGVAVHAVPRLLGASIERPGQVRALLPLLLGHVVLRAVAQFVRPEWQPALLTAAAALGMGGTGLFAWIVWRLRKRSAVAPQPFHGWIAWGTVWWFVAASLSLAGAVDALRTGDAYLALLWNESVYAAALYGGALFWIVGMLGRIGPVFLGLSDDLQKRWVHVRIPAVVAVSLLTSGTLLQRRFDQVQSAGMILAGMFLLAVVTGVLVLRSGVYARRAPDALEVEPFSRRAAQFSFGALALFAIASVAHVALELTSGSNHLVTDAARHAFSIGFVMLLTLALGTRILPIFSGRELAWGETRSVATNLLAAAVVLRFAQIGAGLGFSRALALSAASGMLGTVGALVYCAILWRTLTAPSEAERAREKSRVSGEIIVADLIEQYPASLEVLLRHGFTPLGSEMARKSLARTITLEQACRMRGRDLRMMLREIKKAIELARSAS